MADESQSRVVRKLLSVLFVLAVVEIELDGGPEQKRPEEEKDPAESVDSCGTDGDEDAAENQCQDDADQQRELLQVAGHFELRQNDKEEKEVVDRQAVLGY